MDDKEPKTEEGLVSHEGASHGAVSPEMLTGLQNAQHVTLNDKNKTKPNKDPGRDPGVGLQPEQSSFSLSHILSVASVYR